MSSEASISKEHKSHVERDCFVEVVEHDQGARQSMSEELSLHVTVDSTTFGAAYEVKDGVLFITSAEFGERTAVLGNRLPAIAAEQLLLAMAEKGVRDTDIPFFKDRI